MVSDAEGKVWRRSQSVPTENGEMLHHVSMAVKGKRVRGCHAARRSAEDVHYLFVCLSDISKWRL